MARTLIRVPPNPKRGEPMEVRVTIAHPMETGYRPGADGRLLARDIIRSFTCRYNAEVVFTAELFPAIAANPYLSFFVLPTENGVLEFEWSGDNGFAQAERVPVTLT